MPDWLPEGNTVFATDSEIRTLAKWCQLLYNSEGNKPSPFPEGCVPRPGDNEDRLLKKIAILKGS